MILLITNMRFEEIKMMMLHFQQFTTQKKDSELTPSLFSMPNYTTLKQDRLSSFVRSVPEWTYHLLHCHYKNL